MELSEAQERLELYTQAIAREIEDRFDWMEHHLSSLATFKVGDTIYARVAANDYKLQRAGVVTEVYLKRPMEGRLSVPKVCYKFTPDPTYSYGNDTDSSWASFYGEEVWQREKRSQIAAIKRELTR